MGDRTDDLTTYGIQVDDKWKVFYLLGNPPKSAEWSNRRDMLEMGGRTETSTELISNLLIFKARIKQEGAGTGFSSVRHTSAEREGYRYWHIYRRIGIEIENYLFWVWVKRP